MTNFLHSLTRSSAVLWLILLTLGIQPALSQAQQTAESGAQPGASLFSVQDEFLPVTEAFQLESRIENQELILHWQIAPGYYLYEERFKVRAENGVQLTPTFSQGTSKFDEYFSKDMVVFHDSATLTIPLPANAQAFALEIGSQGCADAGLCYPPQTQYLHIDPPNQQAALASADESDALAARIDAQPIANTIEEEPLWLLHAIVLAIFGGMILNLMPCVFPVLSIKIMSLAQADRAHLARHGWVYTAGIVLCFLVFAGALLLARAGGEAIGWGFQLQSPLLIAALAYLFFVMGLSLSGMINIGTSWMGAGQSLTQKSGLTGSFFTGVLAAIVASPCTAPFMGAALGFALTQPGFVSLSVFAALGFGMALPMLVLCYVPALADRLPRPGAWMETLKEILAFPLYLTSVWLLWVLGRQAGVDVLITVCVGGIAIVFSIWLLNRPGKGLFQQLRRLLIAGSWVVAILIPWQLLNASTEPSRWQAYNPELLKELRESGKPVFVNLTADWCITCLANERVALGTDDVAQVFDELEVATLKGDWTNRDPMITQLLSEYGRSGVPLYLWFPADHEGKGQLLPQLLTKASIIEALKSEAAVQ